MTGRIKHIGLAFVLAGCTLVTAGVSSVYGQQFDYHSTPLMQVIDDLETRTSYHFLYREALVTSVNITLQAEGLQVFESLKSRLSGHAIAMRIDSARQQVVIYPGSDSLEAEPGTITGYVVDAETGERLPYATIQWQDEDDRKGTMSNTAGYFVIDDIRSIPVVITASYIGYAPSEAEINSPGPVELTVRLSPSLIDGNEIVVTGQPYYSPVNHELQEYVDIGSFSPLGESNSIRGLQQLPSVSITTAMSNGINVRGSAADGFHILLDGAPVFNQSHLFGLVDSFNSDVLRRTGFFYDVTPAMYEAPPGGTLTLLTKTGSLNRFNGSVGLSNSSYRATVEGPIRKGKSSWLLSGRHSYLNSIDWLNNSSLIEWGLNIDRPGELLEENLVDVESELISPGNYQARFYDLHGKLYFEGESGGRFYINGYYGADDTDQQADRLFRNFDESGSPILSPEEVETKNRWDNFAGSIHYEKLLSPDLFSHTFASLSVYETDFLKEDFTYIQFDDENNLTQAFVFPFQNRSIINEFKFSQSLDLNFDTFLWTTGATYQYYLGEYFENSFDRPGFYSRETAHKIDGYTQLDFNRWEFLQLNTGIRLHYYSNGSFLRASPRFKMKILPEKPVSLSLGYSRNFKFLHQVNLNNVVSADVWVLSNNNQPPSEVDYFTSGIYLKPLPFLYLQVEGYLKKFDNLRLHEINTQSLTNTFGEAPWFFDNNGSAKGVELVLQNDLDLFSLTQVFTWSRTEYSNSRINDGEQFPAEWDRTYRYSLTADAEPLKNLHLHLSWMYATGIPNQLYTFGPDSVSRLGDYYRTDLSIEYKNADASFGDLELSVSLFNLFNRKNPWYREYTFVVDPDSPSTRLETVPTTVFDLGFQPSFKISLGL